MTSARRSDAPASQLTEELRELAARTGHPLERRSDRQVMDGLRLLRRAVADAAAVATPALR